MKQIKIIAGDVSAVAELSNGKTSDAIWNSLPIENTVNTWGDEIYFTIPVTSALDETAKEVVEKGDLGYWPTGKAFCIFFGPTPVSQGEVPRAYSPVNIFGKVVGDATTFKQAGAGSLVRVVPA